MLGADGSVVAEALGNYNTDSERMEANALLIAAAPDLLEALKDLLGDDGWGCDRLTYLKARAAIRKAEGRE